MKETIWKTILTCLLFVIMQGIIGTLIALPLAFQNKPNESPSLAYPGLLAAAIIVSDIASVWAIWKLLGTIRPKETFAIPEKPTSKRVLAICLGTLAFITGTFGINLLTEQIDITDQLEAEFLAMSHNWIGILGLSIAGPVTEELVFREGITGYWLRKGHSPWVAIIVSSLIFGLIHMNPVQVFSAFLIGLLLGTLYWKTRNIWLCSAMHILNNSVSVLLLYIYGEESNDMFLTGLLGSAEMAWIGIFVCTLVSIGLAYAFCRLMPKKEA